MTETNPTSPDISAKAGTYYRVTRYLMVLMFIVMGAWFAYDGFINWPAQNRAAPPGTKAPHSDLDLLIQKLLACALPPLGIVMLIWTLRNSRGEYRLTGATLQVPGHPPVPLDSIRRIDKKLWDRKGIAYIDYEIPGGTSEGRLKLDDFVYEREGTDAIFKRIEEYLFPPSENDAASSAAEPSSDN